MTERKQDMWHVLISGTDKMGEAAHPMQLEGALSLPRPMDSMDTADHALRLAVERASKVSSGVPPMRITASVWGLHDKGGDERHMCSAVADYFTEERTYRRYCPWVGDNEYREVQAPEGAVLHEFSN